MTEEAEIRAQNTEAPAGYAWRPGTRDDVPSLHRLLERTDAADGREQAGTLEDQYRQYVDPWLDWATDSRVAIAPDGSVAALARVLANPTPRLDNRAHLAMEVDPAHRGHGLESALLSWMERRGAQKLAEIAARSAIAAPLPRDLMVGVPDHMGSTIALLEAHRFAPIRYFVRMRRDLSQPIPPVRLPGGIRLRTYAAELEPRVLNAYNESFRDHWSHEEVLPDEWQTFVVGRSSFRPDLSPVALEGEQVVGISMNRVSSRDFRRQGFSNGHLGSVGVRRPWRKRGVASALIVHSMHAFKAEGLEYATLGVDAENPSGALGLYSSLGFVTYRRFINYARPLQEQR